MLGFGGVWGASRSDKNDDRDDDEVRPKGNNNNASPPRRPRFRSKSSFTKILEHPSRSSSPHASRSPSLTGSSSSPLSFSSTNYPPTPVIDSLHQTTLDDVFTTPQSFARRGSDAFYYSSTSGEHTSGSSVPRPRFVRSISSQSSLQDLRQREDDERDLEITSRDLDPSTSTRLDSTSATQPFPYDSLPPQRSITRTRKSPPSPERIPRLASSRHNLLSSPEQPIIRRPSIRPLSGFSSSSSSSFDPKSIDLDGSSSNGSLSYRFGSLPRSPPTATPHQTLHRTSSGVLAPSSFFGGREEETGLGLLFGRPPSISSLAESSAGSSGAGSAVMPFLSSDTETQGVEPPIAGVVEEEWQVDTSSTEGELTTHGKKTNHPMQHIQADLDHTLRDLLSKEAFKTLLQIPMARHRFQEHLAREGKQSSLSALAIWSDSDAIQKLSAQLEAAKRAIHSTFFSTTAPFSSSDTFGGDYSPEVSTTHDPTSASNPSNLDSVNTDGRSLDGPLGGLHDAAERALDQLYANDFISFIKQKIIDGARLRLGMFSAREERGDLGEVFCMTDPNQTDHPIIMVSDAFCTLTEYDRVDIVGRNCRFLQGPSTDKTTVERLRLSLAKGDQICEIILNYKQNGAPFWNCLSMMPLRDRHGEIVHFIAGQVDVSRALSSPTNLALLIGAGELSLSSGRMERLAAEASKIDGSGLALSAEVVSVLEKNDCKTIFHSRKTFLSSRSSQGEDERDEQLDSPDCSSAGSSPRLQTNKRLEAACQTSFPLDTSRDGLSSKATMVYNKLLIFDATEHKVLFATPLLEEQLGYLACTEEREHDLGLYDTSFVAESLTLRLSSLPISSTSSFSLKLVTLRLQDAIRTAVAEKRPYSVRGGLRQSSHSLKTNRGAPFVDEKGAKFFSSLMHLTPLKNGDGHVESYAVIFGH